MNTARRPGESDFAFFVRNVAMAATACMWAEVCTIPIDTAKVRMQLQKVAEGEKPRYNGMIGT